MPPRPPRRRPSVHGRSSASHSSSRYSRVIEARMRSSNGGVYSRPPATQKNDHVGPSRTRPCGVTSSASSKPALARQAAGEHVPGVGERLQPVEHARRRVRDGRDAGDRRPRRQRLDGQDPAPAAGQHHSQQRVDRPGGSEQGVDLGPQGADVELQPQPRAGALEPRHVLGERERPPAVQAHDLEGAVAARESLVGDRDPGLLGRADRSVQAGQHEPQATAGR